MQKKLTVLFAFAIFVLVMGWAITPAQAHDCSRHDDKTHKHCDPPTDPEPIIEPCTVALCIASVGRRHRPPAREYAELNNGNYTEISSSRFSQILGTLFEGDAQAEGDAEALCNAYHVLIIEYSSPKINNLNWQRLLDYMACGGGVIFEDPKNVEALAPAVSAIEVDLHGGGDFPLNITLAPVPVPAALTSGFDSSATFINKHFIFVVDASTDPVLMPFLTLDLGEVVGLYGEFDGGRIVLTAPDNNFHGILDVNPDSDPQTKAKGNHYNLLFNEIDWLLLASCGDEMTDLPFEECDGGDSCSAVCTIE